MARRMGSAWLAVAAWAALAISGDGLAQPIDPDAQSLGRLAPVDVPAPRRWAQGDGGAEEGSPFAPTVAGGSSVATMAAVAAAPEIDLEPPAWLEPLQLRLDQAAGYDKTVGLAVAIIEQGQPVMIYTAGEAAAGSGEPVTAQTRFRAASLTKSFTGVLLAVLEEQGLVDLDQPVPTALFDLKGARQPTWLELVSHRTGLPPNAFDNLIEDGADAVAARRRLAEVDLICAPGECYSYQNLAFSALETLIEDATGLSYEEAVRRYLFEPYGLSSAGVGEDDLVSAASWARPHRGWRRTEDRAGDPSSTYDRLPSAASVTLTLDDLVAWAQAHLAAGGSGLPEAVRERVFTPYTETRRETRGLGALRERVSETHYGMGWRVYEWGDRTLIAHSGYLSGYGAQVVMEPATGFAFVALWNSDGRAPWRLWPTVMDLRTGDGPGDWIDQIEQD